MSNKSTRFEESAFWETLRLGSVHTGQALRKRAERILRKKADSSSDNTKPLLPEEIRSMVHDLQVHQIELEMQNEELRQTQVKLHTARTHYFDLYDLAPVGYVTISQSGLILETNITAATLLDLPRGALVKRPISDFFLNEDQDIYYLHHKRLFETGEPQVCELRMVKKDETVFHARLHATLAHSSESAPVSRVSLSDITECKQTEEVRGRLAAIAACRGVAIIGKDLDGTIQSWNKGAEGVFGYKAEEVVGKSVFLLIPPGYKDEIPDILKRISQGEILEKFESIRKRIDGTTFPVSLTYAPIKDASEKVIGVSEVVYDLTERKQAEKQLQAINNELELRVEQRTRELQESQKQYLHAEKLSAIGKLSASIAHEFNNPLQGIMSILNGLKKRAILEEEDKELLDEAIGESNRMKDLIQSLQDFNRPSSGKKTLMDVHRSLDSILLIHKSDFNKKRISVERYYAEQLPQILVVPDQIKQVFLNLLTNAADACDKPGGVITASTWQENDRVAVAIRDTGVGIKPEQMEHIFQPFFTTKAEVKGTGLGLSVSYGIVQKHHGEIRVESQPGEGATFTVLLPINGNAAVASAIDE